MEKQTLTEREAEAWAEFRAQVDRLTPEQREQPDANADGWSMRDVLWHIAHWWNDLAGMVEEVNRGGTFVEPPEDDEATNADNARILAESRQMTIDAVERRVLVARERLLAAWSTLSELDEALERWFVWETIEHYEEHLDDARRFAEEVGRG
jgi:hypothetical protein